MDNTKPRTTLITGYKFNGESLLRCYQSVGHLVTVVSGTPRFKWTNKPDSFRGLPAITKALKAINLPTPKILRHAEILAFNKLASFYVGNEERVHALAGYALNSFKCSPTAKKILDRSCPHVNFQNALLNEESSLTGIPYVPISRKISDLMEAEYDAADEIFVPSIYTASSFKMNDLAKKIILNPIITNEFFKPVSFNKNNNRKKFVVGFLGGNVLRKGLIYLLKSAQLLRDYDIDFIIKTSGVEFAKLPAEYQLLAKNNSRVSIITQFIDLDHFFNHLSIFVLPSIDEGFGMVTFEALARGVPVIGTENVGAMGWINSNFCSTVRIRDPISIAHEIIRYYDQMYVDEIREEIQRNYKSVCEQSLKLNVENFKG